MREVVRGSQFRRDVKLAEKRGKDMSKLRYAVMLLIEAAPLPTQYRDHSLTGNWKHHRDLHIEPDWLLLYKIDDNELYLARTGSHSDLFKK